MEVRRTVHAPLRIGEKPKSPSSSPTVRNYRFHCQRHMLITSLFQPYLGSMYSETPRGDSCPLSFVSIFRSKHGASCIPTRLPYVCCTARSIHTLCELGATICWQDLSADRVESGGTSRTYCASSIYHLLQYSRVLGGPLGAGIGATSLIQRVINKKAAPPTLSNAFCSSYFLYLSGNRSGSGRLPLQLSCCI
jgi:hypothetical protein